MDNVERKSRGMWLQKGARPAKLLARLQAGEKKTITEWAKAFGMTYGWMSGIIHGLRKHGHHYRPFRGQMRVGGVMKTNIVVDITEKEEWLISGLNTYEDNYSLPAIKSQFRMLEDGIKKHPRVVADVEPYIESLQLAMIEGRKALRAEQKLLGEQK